MTERTMPKTVAVWLLLGFLVGVSGFAADAADQGLDPLVAEVVEMLDAGVSDGLILQWLESTGRRPVDIGSEGLIALTEAQASESLMSRLLELVGEERPGATMAPPAATQTGPTLREVSSAEAADGSLEVIIRLSGKRMWVEEDEPDSPRDERWNVFLYLDGDLVAWTRPDQQGEAVEARRVIRAGSREMRVILQRYEKVRGGWTYESLAVPTLVAFDAQVGDPLEIEVDLKRSWGLWRDRNDGGPLSYVIRQGVRVLGESDGAGGNPVGWQPVCEDVEANFPESQGVPRAYRSSMSRCVRWADLWNGPGQNTSRTEILEDLAEYDFEPPVR